ncbi:Uncharacterized protein Adt_05539 [Abeliophyllum distichum]|uniref:Transposase (putative) gypsy type domain-containing protein n=1 Tax=Abeliophyllum distichum TaxID=126358 RepID=A0ABD1V6I6_9LAMI
MSGQTLAFRDESPLSSSSSEVVGEVNQASPASCPSTPSASGKEVSPTVLLKKVGGSGPEERADDPPEGFVAIYEPAIQQGLRLPMHPFFHEVLKDWNLAPFQITPNGWGQMVALYILWVFVEVGGNLTPREFESIYRPCQSSGWYNVSPRPSQKWGTATDSPNKVHNWKERFFFVGRDWEFIPDDPLPHVSISRRFGLWEAANPEEEPKGAKVEVGQSTSSQ